MLTRFPDGISVQSTGAEAFGQQYSTYPSNIGELQSAIPNPAQTPSYNSQGVIEDMLDIPAQLDWVRAPATFLDAYQTTNQSFIFRICTTVTFQVSKWPPITAPGTPMVQQLRTILVRILLAYRRWITRATSNDDGGIYIYLQCYEPTLCFSCTSLSKIWRYYAPEAYNVARSIYELD